MKRWCMGLALLSTLAVAAEPAYDWKLPAWVPPPVVPADNPMSEAKVELGRHLFYDRRLSLRQNQSCATCHQQARGFSDGRPLPFGSTGQRGVRNAMSLANIAYLPVLTWANPNLKQPEQQALVPLFGEHPVEMGMAGREAELLARLRSDPHYPPLFQAAFPDGEISLATVVRAIAAFERALLSFDSPYDRYRYGGDKNALSAAARRGERLFFGEKMECYHCHGGINFTDNLQHSRLAFPELGFHNTGLFNLNGQGAYPAGQQGLREFSGEAADEGKFRTPSLRNVALSAPYMHDGSIPTLAAVIRSHYAKKGMAVTRGQRASPLRSQFIEGFRVSEREVRDLVAFLQALTDHNFVTNPRFADPFAAGRADRSPSAVSTASHPLGTGTKCPSTSDKGVPPCKTRL
ncbi:MbnH family di-heme enzyme [Chitinimonas lacunae]|uniref:MbnH family di-heme enzyme n=1 Tax=Chitinimonas lacunae TaxID=1963018 RepID=A0ABV8MKB6_9NEIS